MIASVTGGDGTALVEWTPVSGVTTYEVYWSTSPIADLSAAENATGLTGVAFTVTGLTNGETYHFVVRAVARKRAATSAGSRVTLAPSGVENVTITGGDGYVTLSWDEVHGAKRYDIYRGTSPQVTKLTGKLFTTDHPPYTDTTVTNGTSYYYIVHAVGVGGQSKASGQVGATPKNVVGAPQNPSATVVEGQPRTVTLSWTAPSVGNPDSYNIYYDTMPGVTVGTNQVAGVTSPHTVTGLTGQTTYYFVVTAVESGVESPSSMEVSGTPKGGKGGGGSTHTEGLGNNLSFPMAFATGHGTGGLTLDASVTSPWLDFNTGLRPTTTDVIDPFPYFDPRTVVNLNGVKYYPQNTESTWQADWRNVSSENVDVVLDWGDNLTSAHFSYKQGIRIEAVLYQDTSISNPADTMTAYTMTLLGGSGSTESYGTDGTTYESNQWTVFSPLGRLRIEKLQDQGGPVDPGVIPFESAVYENLGEEHGGFGVEVNVSGRLVYGYVWMLRTWPISDEQKQGWWRLTFSLDKNGTFGTPSATVNNNVSVIALDPSETIATLDPGKNSSSIEILVE